MRRLLIVGAGGHGRSVAEAVLAGTTYELAGFLDNAVPALNQVWHVPVLGDGAGVDLEASGLQFLPHLGEQRLTELVVIE